MLRFVPGDRLAVFPRLAASMFRDRAAQFRDRLGWAVHVDQAGWERDEYDAGAALYVIWERPDGTHGGSMRFLPTTGAHMVRDHVQRLGGQAAGLAHALEILGAVDGDAARFAALLLHGLVRIAA